MEIIDIIGNKVYKCIKEVANNGEKCVECFFKCQVSDAKYDGLTFIFCAKYLFMLSHRICLLIYFVWYSKITRYSEIKTYLNDLGISWISHSSFVI